ncbi:hypothetical protein [Streptomyces sp. WAC 04229]|uniref:hypothetical protein n=1 Tax=Streptomyces sp. WAC 04229 TaxID=2203206 RepID=UPI00163C8470|nr:hypothetical protein [Streptomyces sp. WAC 04229]
MTFRFSATPRGARLARRDVLDIKEDVYAGDFKVELSQGFTGKAAGRVEEYVDKGIAP